MEFTVACFTIGISLLGPTLLISKGSGQILLNRGDVYGFTAGITCAVGGAMVKLYDKVRVNSLFVFLITLCSNYSFVVGLNLRLIAHTQPKLTR